MSRTHYLLERNFTPRELCSELYEAIKREQAKRPLANPPEHWGKALSTDHIEIDTEIDDREEETLCGRVESYILEKPVKAMLIALAAGFVFGRVIL